MTSPRDDGDETFTVRLSARTTQSRFDKLVRIAKDKDWLNSQDRPNISRVLNFIIDKFPDPGRARRRRRKR